MANPPGLIGDQPPATGDSGDIWGGITGLLGKVRDTFGSNPAAEYGGLLSDPATQREFAWRALGAAAASLGQSAMPVPYKGGTPWGAALGLAGGAAATAGDSLIKARMEQAQQDLYSQQAAVAHGNVGLLQALPTMLKNYYGADGGQGGTAGTGTGATALTGPAAILARQGGGGGSASADPNVMKGVLNTAQQRQLTPAATTALVTVGLGEGGFDQPWAPSGIAGETSMGPWQFNSGSHLPAYLEKNKPGDVPAMTNYTIDAIEKDRAAKGLTPFASITDPAEAIGAVAAFENSALYRKDPAAAISSYSTHLPAATALIAQHSGASPQTASAAPPPAAPGSQPPTGLLAPPLPGGALPPGSEGAAPGPQTGLLAPRPPGAGPIPPSIARNSAGQPYQPIEPGGAVAAGTPGASPVVTPQQAAAANAGGGRGLPVMPSDYIFGTGKVAPPGAGTVTPSDAAGPPQAPPGQVSGLLSPNAAAIAQGMAAAGALRPTGSVAGDNAVPTGAPPVASPADAAAARAAAMGQEGGGMPGLITGPPPTRAVPAPPAAPVQASQVPSAAAPASPQAAAIPGTAGIPSPQKIAQAQQIALTLSVLGKAIPPDIAETAKFPMAVALANATQQARVGPQIQIDTAQQALITQREVLLKQLQAGYDTVEVPVRDAQGNYSTVTMTRAQAGQYLGHVNAQLTGLPPQGGGGAAPAGATPGAPGTMPAGKPFYTPEQEAQQKGTGEALAKEYQQILTDQEASLKGKPYLLSIQQALQTFNTPGAGADIKLDAMKTLQSTFSTAGLQLSPQMQNWIANGEIVSKSGTQLGFELARSLGPRESQIIVQQAIKNNPGLGTTLEGNKDLMALMGSIMDRNDAKRQFYDEWYGSHNQSYAGAQTAFNKANPWEVTISQFAPYQADKMTATEYAKLPPGVKVIRPNPDGTWTSIIKPAPGKAQ